MKTLKQLSLCLSLTLLAASQATAGTSIGVQFLGRDGSPDQTGNPGVPAVSGTAGVIPISLWNPIDNAHAFATANQGESQQLLDSNQASTLVTLLFDGNDSWYNDVTPTNIHSGNAMLMNGIIKASSGGGVPASFVFTNVTEGQYDLYVYTSMNGDNTKAKFWDKDRTITYYVTEQHQFYDTNTFVQGVNTDPNSPSITNICGYVKFSNLGTYGTGTIGASGQWISGNDGIGVAALQLVNIGPPAVNTNPVAILTQPVNRRGVAAANNVTFSVVTSGSAVTYQWYKGGVAVSGATDSTFTPVIASGDNGAVFYVIAKNNVNSVQSSNAVLTVGQNVLLAAIDEKLWYGANRTDVENGLYDTNTPDIHNVLFTFSTKEEQGDNYGERIAGIFVAPVTTNYTFFVTSDDDSDLWLSTDATPANKRLIAQEVDWSGQLTWLSNGGGTGANQITQKRSDQWNNGTSVPFANGIPLVAGTSYYIENDHHEGGGGDAVDVTFKIVGEPDPQDGTPSRITPAVLGPYVQAMDGGYIVITNQPQNATVPQGHGVTLSVAAYSGFIGDNSGAAPAIFYQWQSAPSGSTTFTDITGAHGSGYATPVLALSDSGIQYRVHMLAEDASSNSAIATISVVNDTNPPVLLASGALVGSTQVGVTFNKALDPVTAGNPANYTVNGVAATAATVLTNNPPSTNTVEYLVQLTVASPVTANFTLNVTGVKDAIGNTMNNASMSGTALNMTSTSIGSVDPDLGSPDPQLPAVVNVVGPDAIDVLANGNDYWNNADGMNFIWTPKTNSFDVKVRLVSVQNTDEWAAGAIEVREGPVTTNGGGWELARHYFCKVDYNGEFGPPMDGSGSVTSYEYNGRRAPGDPTLRETSNSGPGTSQGWGGTAGPAALGVAPFPNAWIRIARVRSADGTSDHMMGYLGTDGQTWALAQDVDLNDATHAGFLTSGGTNAGPWPTVCYVGLASVSHTGIGNGNPTNAKTGQPYQSWIIYRNWGDTAGSGGGTTPTLNFKNNGNGTLTLTYTGNLYSATTLSGTVTWTLVSGASSPYTPPNTGAKAIFYRAGP